MSLNANDAAASTNLANTRHLLLAAAAPIFAAKGFQNTTIREICHHAGANIAAVNYHFRDKEGLYREVLRFTMQNAQSIYPLYGPPTPNTPPELQLKTFVRAYLQRIFDEGPHSLHGKLVARELIEPTSAMDTLVEEEFRPIAAHLITILRALLGRRASESVIRLCGMSLVSQCLFYHQCKDAMSRLFPDMRFGTANIEQLTEHITRFSLAGIQSYAHLSNAKK